MCFIINYVLLFYIIIFKFIYDEGIESLTLNELRLANEQRG